MAMDRRESIINQTDVALAIARHLFFIKVKGSNPVFSPLSLNVVVSLIAAGAKGPSLDQLLTFLKLKSTAEINTLSSKLVSVVFTDGSTAGGPKISFVNNVWINQTLSFNPSFKEVVVNQYKTAYQHVDFQSEAMEVGSKVNARAEKETNGLIKDVVPPNVVNRNTMLILANALHFKGAWSEKFDESETIEDDFHLLDGSSVKVPFMASMNEQVIGIFYGFKVLGLPYKVGKDNCQFSMYILLPDAKDGLPTLVEKVGSQSGFLDRHLPTAKVDVNDFQLPRFKIAFGFEASETLKEFGVSLPFTGGGLSEMVDSVVGGESLCVSSIFQKSFIEVNEEGTEAASVSAVVISNSCNKVDFVTDHPFMFLIREDTTGVILFIGHVLNPLTNK